MGILLLNGMFQTHDEQEQPLSYRLNPDQTGCECSTPSKPILLVAANEFVSPAPIFTTSPDYVIQLNEQRVFKTASNEGGKLVEYWGASAAFCAGMRSWGTRG